MKKSFSEYVRVARGFFGCSSFWRGNGHYLYIKGSGFLLPFSEEYFRFEFLKVQSVVATKTARGTVTSIFCGAGAIIAALLLVASISGLDCDGVSGDHRSEHRHGTDLCVPDSNGGAGGNDSPAFAVASGEGSARFDADGDRAGAGFGIAEDAGTTSSDTCATECTGNQRWTATHSPQPS
jgi:hypothetical protein